MKRIYSQKPIILLLVLWLFSPVVLWTADSSGKVQLPPYKKITMDNGMTLLLMERHELPLVDFQWILKSGGALCDPAGKEGLASLTSELLRKGTQKRSADQISESLDFVGATFDSGASLQFAYGEAEFLKKDLSLALDLIPDMLIHPTFPKSEINKMVQQEIDGIKESKAVPQRVIQRYFEQMLYGSQPYGRPVGGTGTSLSQITREDIATFYGSHFVPNQMILAVVGDFNALELEAGLKDRFAGWKPKEVTVPAVKEASPVEGKHILVVDKPDSTQTFFRIGNLGVTRTSPDWIPIQVVNTLFGGRFTSMINEALRIKSGLTYGASSFFSARKSRGSFTIGSFTPTESTERALNMTFDVLKSLHEKRMDEAQLTSAKNYIKGQFGPTIETNDQLAETISELEFYGLGADDINTYIDKVDAMTLADARRIIDRYFPLDNLDIVLIGKASEVGPIAKRLAADVKTKSITDPGF